MDIGAAITVLGTAVNLISIGISIKEWLFVSIAKPSELKIINEALQFLPNNAPPEKIIEILKPIFIAKGGSVLLSAGNNAGGDLQIKNATIEGGSGPAGGGSVKISGGDGGPLGKGGVTTISNTTIKGGSVK